MKRFKFFGAHSLIEGVAKLTKLGQVVELDEGLARSLTTLPILPEEMFDSVGITADELKAYSHPADVVNAPIEFQVKRDALSRLRAEWLAQ